ncbi:MAG: proteasome assembly chaperone family protein [Planctomycetota bacterium]|jgi:proteasome assembly chaperone (PAC2) family protein
MASDKLQIYRRAKLKDGKLLMGLSGWMDGGNISTGVVRFLIEQLDAQEVARIEPEGFYIYNFPGTMEISALFRPHAMITDGIIESYDVPANEFFLDEENDLVLFLGKEPNLGWSEYDDCVFSLCRAFDIKTIYFIGSVAGLVPHTRQPRFLCSVSDEELKEKMIRYGVRLSNYEGPASIVTHLTVRAGQEQIDMTTLVAEIPAYVQGHNPCCVSAVAKLLTNLLGVHLDLEEIRRIGEEFERKLSEIVGLQPELARHIARLEEDYDNEVFDTEMGDLKDWLQQQGIRVD